MEDCSLSPLSLFFLSSDKHGVRVGVAALLPECVVSYIIPLHTHTESLFFYLLVSSVSSRPPTTTTPPEYAMKAVGSLVPTHFHNLANRDGEGGTERGGQRGEFLLSPSSFPLSEDADACCPCQGGGGRREKRKWLPFTLEPELIVCFLLTSSHSLPPSLCFYTFKMKARYMCF